MSNKIEPLTLNVLNWHYEDNKDENKFLIYGFSKTITGENITLQIENFKPEMFIRIRLNSNDIAEKNKFMNNINTNNAL